MNYSNPEVQSLFDDYEFSVDTSVETLINQYKQMRAGRANPHIIEHVRVDYYGQSTSLNQVGNISIAEARVLVINVWDISMLKIVEKAIIAANVGINPVNDGKVIRLIFPELTTERRNQLVKDVRSMAENMKVSLRNHRRDINDALKAMKKDSKISEDDQVTYEKEVDKIQNKAIETIDKTSKEKEKEILTV